jgi:hypothetical protein
MTDLIHSIISCFSVVFSVELYTVPCTWIPYNKKYSKAPVSSAHALVYYMPYRPQDKWDKMMTEFCDIRDHEFFFHAMRTGEIVYPLR